MSSKIQRYEGKELTITYDPDICTHAGECVRGLPEVFDVDKKPWIDPDGASAEAAIEVIGRCPSGALQYERPDAARADRAAEAETPVNRISIVPGGPLIVQGEVEIQQADGTVLRRDKKVALCRCGASANKPFCDGKHNISGFEDPGTIETERHDELSSGALVVKLADNGPLLLQGPVEIYAAEAEEPSYCATKGALCRCGASGNTPFCDGRHKEIGFET